MSLLTPYEYLLQEAGNDDRLLREAARVAGIDRSTLWRWKARSANALWWHVQEVRRHILRLRAQRQNTKRA